MNSSENKTEIKYSFVNPNGDAQTRETLKEILIEKFVAVKNNGVSEAKERP